MLALLKGDSSLGQSILLEQLKSDQVTSLRSLLAHICMSIP
jgi:hypothetical protein